MLETDLRKIRNMIINLKLSISSSMDDPDADIVKLSEAYDKLSDAYDAMCEISEILDVY